MLVLSRPGLQWNLSIRATNGEGLYRRVALSLGTKRAHFEVSLLERVSICHE